jgi:hypothetical protein
MLPTKFRFIWPSGFRGEDFFKSVNQKQELPGAAMFVNGSGQNEHSLQRTFHRCFLLSFSSFGWGVSEKIKMWKVNRRQTPSDGKSSNCFWQGELKIKCFSYKFYENHQKIKLSVCLYTWTVKIANIYFLKDKKNQILYEYSLLYFFITLDMFLHWVFLILYN